MRRGNQLQSDAAGDLAHHVMRRALSKRFRTEFDRDARRACQSLERECQTLLAVHVQGEVMKSNGVLSFKRYQ